MKILFIGCVKSSYILLKTLYKEQFNIVGVITKQQSAFNADYYDLAPFCIENNLDYIYTTDINNKETVNYIKEKEVDIIYCFGWSQLIKEEVLNIPKIGSVGFHPAKLPYNRGRHPIIWTLVLGLEETASTFFWLDNSADTGDIISQECINIQYEDTANILYNKILDVAKEQIIKFSYQFEKGNFIRKRQNIEGNAWRKRSIKDGIIDWRMSGRAIYNLVRALSKPYVGAHFIYNNMEVKVWKVEEIAAEKYKNIEPGKVLKVDCNGEFYVKSYDNIIHVIESDKIILKEGIYLE